MLENYNIVVFNNVASLCAHEHAVMKQQDGRVKSSSDWDKDESKHFARDERVTSEPQFTAAAAAD